MFFGGRFVVACLLLGVASADFSSSYSHTLLLSDDFVVHYTLNATTFSVALNVTTTNWVGFGFSDSGSMAGADMVTIEMDENMTTVTDRFSLSNGFPAEDESCQDWEIVSGEQVDGQTLVELTRDRNVFDLQDHNVSSAVKYVIGAYGSTPSFGYHGTNRFSLYANLESEDPTMDLLAEKRVNPGVTRTVLRNNYMMPTNEDTRYNTICFNFADYGLMDTWITGLEHMLVDNTSEHVHHFVANVHTEEDCEGISYMMYGWARGVAPLVLPDGVGTYIGEVSFMSVSVETHYDSLGPDPIFDTSGVVIFTQNENVTTASGMFSFGDPPTLLDSNLPQGFSKHTFDCPASCTALMSTDEVQVFYIQLHMHDTGTKMVWEQMRDGEVINTIKRDFYDASFQDVFFDETENIQIRRGDSFRTTCYYEETSDSVKFGQSSQEEMCIVFLAFYPHQLYWFSCFDGIAEESILLSSCDGSYYNESLTAVDRVFGSSSDTCDAPNMYQCVEPGCNGTATDDDSDDVDDDDGSGDDGGDDDNDLETDGNDTETDGNDTDDSGTDGNGTGASSAGHALVCSVVVAIVACVAAFM